jgi:hypothetical protein
VPVAATETVPFMPEQIRALWGWEVMTGGSTWVPTATVYVAEPPQPFDALTLQVYVVVLVGETWILEVVWPPGNQ